MRKQLLIATSLIVIVNQATGAKLPKGVVLPPGVVVPDDFELPAGINIPAGFVITQDMVDQYVRYMDTQKKGGAGKTEEDLWFKQLASSHANTNLQLSVQKIDTAEANEEALFQEKLEESLMSKEVILPILAIAVVVIIVWAFMTKCGKRSCCKKNSEHLMKTDTRKSVKSSTNSEDMEAGSQQDKETHMGLREAQLHTDTSQAGSGGKVTASKIVLNETNFKSRAIKVDDVSMAIPFDRASEPNHPSASMSVAPASRSSNVFVQASSTANRLSLPTVSVPIDHIKSVRSRASGSNDAGSVSRPSLVESSNILKSARV